VEATIRLAAARDLSELAAMCHDLWPEATPQQHVRDLAPLIAGHAPGGMPAIVFVAESNARLLGFVHAGLRSHADGCDAGRPVGFIEGWYVAPESRRQQIGARLIAVAETWARTQGCVEMGSDTWLDAVDSQQAHESLGYEEVDRCVHYRKQL